MGRVTLTAAAVKRSHHRLSSTSPSEAQTLLSESGARLRWFAVSDDRLRPELAGIAAGPRSFASSCTVPVTAGGVSPPRDSPPDVFGEAPLLAFAQSCKRMTPSMLGRSTSSPSTELTQAGESVGVARHGGEGTGSMTPKTPSVSGTVPTSSGNLKSTGGRRAVRVVTVANRTTAQSELPEDSNNYSDPSPLGAQRTSNHRDGPHQRRSMQCKCSVM